MSSRRRSWWIVLAAAGAGGAVLLAPLLLRGVVERQVDPAALVRRAEQKWNCRAEISGSKVDWSFSGAKLVLQGVSMGRRDAAARDGIPLAQRQPMREAVLRAGELRLSLAPWALLRGSLHARELVARGVQLDVAVPEEGDNTLKALFRDPDEEKEERPRRRERRNPGEERPERDSEGDLALEDLPFAAQLDRAAIEDASVYVQLERYGTRIVGTDVSAELTNIRIEPGALGRENHADLEVRGVATLDQAQTGGIVYGQLRLAGGGEITPFDSATGELEPEVRCRLDVEAGSFIDVMPMLDKVERRIGDLKEFGVQLEELELKGDIRSQSVLHLGYRSEVYTLLSDSELEFEQYALRLGSGSWYNADDNTHEFQSGVTLTPEVTEKGLAKLDRFVERKLKVVEPATVRRIVEGALVRDGRLSADFQSRGDLGDPEVDLTSELPDLTELLKDAARDLTKDPQRLIDGLRKLFE